MATDPSPDPDRLDRAVEPNGAPTAKAAFTRALEGYIARQTRKRPVDPMAKLEWDQSSG